MEGKPVVAFFDMDHTIIGIDCSVSWKYFLADHGLAPEDDKAKADYYWNLYCQGRTPVDEFVEFQYREFSGKTVDEMRSLTHFHFEERIRPHIYRGAKEKIREFSRDGIPTALVTGTNRYIAERNNARKTKHEKPVNAFDREELSATVNQKKKGLTKRFRNR